ncbi:MAG: DHH family phosphoesterase [Bacteriovoracaceae bacterium]|nr:DHH family phosphoesterase [Bacteriovoracaceae bacterium]
MKTIYLLSFLLLISGNSWSFGVRGVDSADQNIYVIGHKSPDADSIVGALSLAHYYGYKALRSGPVNAETQYILNYFGVAAPSMLDSIEDKKFFLVDHSVKSQAPSCLQSKDIVGIVDHHPIQEGSFLFNRPININTKSWGSSVSIVASLYFAAKKKISKQMAGIMLGAILSDTSGLDEVKATEHDEVMANKLRKIIGMDREASDKLFQEMVKAKSDLSALSSEGVVLSDYKNFILNGYKVGFGVAETISPQILLDRKQSLLEAMATIKARQNLDFIFFSITDVSPQSKGAHLMVLSAQEEDLAAVAFEKSSIKNIIHLPGFTSRKRQLLPPIRALILQKDPVEFVDPCLQ